LTAVPEAIETRPSTRARLMLRRVKATRVAGSIDTSGQFYRADDRLAVPGAGLDPSH